MDALSGLVELGYLSIKLIKSIHLLAIIWLRTKWLGWAWASPTLAWLYSTRACVRLLACLDRPLTVNHFWLLLCVVYIIR